MAYFLSCVKGEVERRLKFQLLIDRDLRLKLHTSTSASGGLVLVRPVQCSSSPKPITTFEFVQVCYQSESLRNYTYKSGIIMRGK